ncbi:MAG: hypothetical protein K8R44_03080 [Sulfurimonas sp.]|nr:hypothetical protein [Sulfurimonas sp.]
MKFILVLFLTFTFSMADYLVKKTLACPSIMLLKKAPVSDGESGMDATLYIIANNCMVLSKKDKIEAIGYDSRNSKEIYQKILHKKTSKELFILRSTIMVEQSGKKNRLRF